MPFDELAVHHDRLALLEDAAGLALVAHRQRHAAEAIVNVVMPSAVVDGALVDGALDAQPPPASQPSR